MFRFSLNSASAEYKTEREDLRLAEIALTEQRERVAELRRNLPADTPIATNYELTEATGGDVRTVRLSELFELNCSSLIVYHFMWAEKDPAPCPMCTMWIDGFDTVLPHVSQNTRLVLIARQQPGKIRAFANERKWGNLRTISSANTSFNEDFGMETDNGSQLPGLSVFLKSPDNTIRHFYTVSAIMGDGHYRGLDLLSPVWNLLDLLPKGRGDWYPSLDYKAR